MEQELETRIPVTNGMMILIHIWTSGRVCNLSLSLVWNGAFFFFLLFLFKLAVEIQWVRYDE